MKATSVAALPAGFRSAFLDGIAPREIKAVLAAARQETISVNQVLQREGEPVARLWLLVTGRVAVYKLAPDGDKLFLGWKVPGDVFGLAMILREPARYLVTIEAVQEGSLLAWDIASFRALVSRYPSLSRAMHSAAAKSFEDIIDVLCTFAFQTARQRLARALVNSARQLGRTGREGIELDLTNEQLAVAAHMSLFTATRKLSKWQDLGLLKKSRRKVVLPSLSVFEAIAKGASR
jgi:CRP/FNR family cyclic AMP-dependent transcriptional regulator